MEQRLLNGLKTYSENKEIALKCNAALQANGKMVNTEGTKLKLTSVEYPRCHKVNAKLFYTASGAKQQ